MITTFELFINESVKNTIYADHIFKEILLNINKITSSIKRNNIQIIKQKRAWYLEIRWLDKKTENKIINLLKKTQTNLLKSGILLPFKITTHIPYDNPTEKEIWCNMYLKDLYSMRYAPKGKLYHTSSKKNRESIYKNGLMLTGFEKGNFIYESNELYYPPSVFATIDYIWRNDREKNDIWLINTEKLKNKWWLDLNFYKANEINKPREVMTFEPISPEFLTLSNDIFIP
jgi:hypothetical protein